MAKSKLYAFEQNFIQSQFNKFLKLYLILETFGCQFEMIIASKICVMLIRVLETDELDYNSNIFRI